MFKLAILPLRFPSPGVLTSPVHGLVRRDQARARQFASRVVAGRLVAPRLITVSTDPGSSNTLTKTSLKISNSVVNIVLTPNCYALSLRYLASSHLRHHGWR
ncbi:hypothetical protein BJV77DRAFT_1040156 [Russula vinacea]|nr:hypothetical protein BJV77DRAFT_1040156 [Russula vinacea]